MNDISNVATPPARPIDAETLKAEILDNPRDGIWLFARYLSSPADQTLVGQEEMIFAQDVIAVDGQAAH